jgi:F5/8 type C domain-containing protein
MTGLPTVNGYSGYFPAHYEPLRLALEEWDESVLDYLAAGGPLVVAVERGWPYARERLEWLRSLTTSAPQRPTALEVAANDEHVWFLVRGSQDWPTPACGERELPMAAARDWRGRVDLSAVTDKRDDTFWSTGESQRAGDALIVDLGAVARVCSVRLTLGSHTGSYPRALSVATSTDGDRWERISDGKLGGAAVRAAVDRPRRATIELPLLNHRARFVRLQLISNHPRIAWLATEIAVTASPPG